MKKGKGYFITFEGPEGSGKSTQIRVLTQYLRRRGYRVLVLREPGSTRVSEAIRQIILNHDFKELEPETELLLYMAARAQLVRERILPALRSGFIVICDRYEDSTLAYQGYGRGIPLKMIQQLSCFVRNQIVPDVTFLLDISPGAGLSRGGRHDRIERQSMAFHHRVREGFLELARKGRKRFVLIDAAQNRTAIARMIQERLACGLG